MHYENRTYVASQRVLLKNGFQLEGIMKNAVYKNEMITDLHIYGKCICIKNIYNPNGYSIMQNGGVFNDVSHYHLHIFPRYLNDGFGWTYGAGTKSVNVEIAQRIKWDLARGLL